MQGVAIVIGELFLEKIKILSIDTGSEISKKKIHRDYRNHLHGLHPLHV